MLFFPSLTAIQLSTLCKNCNVDSVYFADQDMKTVLVQLDYDKIEALIRLASYLDGRAQFPPIFAVWDSIGHAYNQYHESVKRIVKEHNRIASRLFTEKMQIQQQLIGKSASPENYAFNCQRSETAYVQAYDLEKNRYLAELTPYKERFVLAVKPYFVLRAETKLSKFDVQFVERVF